MQHHHLRKHVQAVQASCHVRPPLWNLPADSEKRIQNFETKCLRKLLLISYLEHKTNRWARNKINFLVGPQKPLLTTVKRRKLAWFGHVTRRDSLSKKSFRALWRVGDAVVDRGNAGWTTSKSGYPCPCLLYTSPSPRDILVSRMPSSA